MHESIISPLPLVVWLGANEADANMSTLGATKNISVTSLLVAQLCAMFKAN